MSMELKENILLSKKECFTKNNSFISSFRLDN